ncbi:winged helix-turn-helix domain-containing protein [Allomesorhizobium alhagi]|uniref:winged helix-turn-helix domain-containing protein n=1 Tax=Allomesorhizobium alhagi TaxID=475067 RepID=UPI001872358B|nr:winged helix-turn-helix domain-containing protein [Mesorhizobium alhagi]
MSPKVMVAEGDEWHCVLIQYALEAEGYHVEIVTRGEEAEIRLEDSLPDLLVLDRMLPAAGVSGNELGRRLRMRPETMQLPIIMLMAQGEERDRLRELSTGFDDYLVKPFTTPELTVRVRTLLRRVKPEVLSDVLVVHDIMLDRRQHQVFRKGRPVQLSPTEFRLLEFMMQHPGRVFSREQLRERVWGNSVYLDGRAVDVFIVRLRRSLKATRDLIRTVRGAGYALGSK